MSEWKQIKREMVYTSPFLEVWKDAVELPGGKVIDDYDGATLSDGVLVVATDENDNLLMFDEYKYAVNDTVLTFPAGGIDDGETPLEAARRELMEETGYEASDYELLASLYPYPSKIAHTSHIVRAKRAKKVAGTQLGEAETVGNLQHVAQASIRELVKSGRLNTPYVIAALALAFPGKL